MEKLEKQLKFDLSNALNSTFNLKEIDHEDEDDGASVMNDTIMNLTFKSAYSRNRLSDFLAMLNETRS